MISDAGIEQTGHEFKAKVFISYSRKDMAFADRLEAALKARGFEPLIDRSDIYAFEKRWERIEALIARADTVAFVLSPDAVASDVALKGVALAASLNKRFAPVVWRRVDDKVIPEPLAEIVVPLDGAFSFDALLQRIHPAQSRVRRLAAETPAVLIVFDLLADSDGTLLIDEPLRERRRALESFVRDYCRGASRIRLSPATIKLSDAKGWLKRVGATLDGVIAKRRDLEYRSADRSGMQKIKNYRSADCVVGGFRYNEGTPVVGSLLLGLYDDDGLLHHVGFTSTIKQQDKAALTRKLRPLIAPPGFTGSTPGGPSRWSTNRSSEWKPLQPKLVVEVCYDHFTGDRFRHGTRLLRWRPDKAPRQCTLDQVRHKAANLMTLLA
jgi:TIR domain/ATP dependent DNA ligase C terminal region/ATP dependent DNA ligase domain